MQQKIYGHGILAHTRALVAARSGTPVQLISSKQRGKEEVDAGVFLTPLAQRKLSQDLGVKIPKTFTIHTMVRHPVVRGIGVDAVSVRRSELLAQLRRACSTSKLVKRQRPAKSEREDAPSADGVAAEAQFMLWRLIVDDVVDLSGVNNEQSSWQESWGQGARLVSYLAPPASSSVSRGSLALELAWTNPQKFPLNQLQEGAMPASFLLPPLRQFQGVIPSYAQVVDRLGATSSSATQNRAHMQLLKAAPHSSPEFWPWWSTGGQSDGGGDRTYSKWITARGMSASWRDFRFRQRHSTKRQIALYKQFAQFSTSASAPAEQLHALVRQMTPPPNAPFARLPSTFPSRLAEALLNQKEALASLLTRETGKPITLSREEVETSADALASMSIAPRASRPLLRPVVVISAFNFPIWLFVGQAVPALLAGNSVIVKPSPHSQKTAEALVRLVDSELQRIRSRTKKSSAKSGIARPSIALVTGGAEAAEALCLEGVGGISFVGSASAGRSLAHIASLSNYQPLFFGELGGSDSAYGHHDALERPDELSMGELAGRLVASFSSHAGQACSSLTRLYLHKSLHDRVLASLQREDICIGSPLSGETISGPSVSFEEQNRRLQTLVDDALAKGAKQATCNVRIVKSDTPSAQNDSFVDRLISPVILYNCNHSMRVCQEDVFGPVLAIHEPVESLDEAISLMNDSEYGLTGTMFTSSAACFKYASARAQVGSFFHNYPECWQPGDPWSGTKASSIGNGSLFGSSVKQWTRMFNERKC